MARTARLLFCLLLVLLGTTAWASFSSYKYQFQSPVDGQIVGPFSSYEAACAAATPLMQTASPSAGYTLTYAFSSSCEFKSSWGGYGFVALQPSGGICPANSSGPGNACTCNSGYSESGAACVKDPTCVSGTVVSSGYYDAGTSSSTGPKAALCSGGCTLVFDGDFPAGSALVGGVKHYFAKGSYSMYFGKCTSGSTDETGSATASESVPSDTCGASQYKGTVNGSTVCVGSTGATTETSSDPGSSTTTTTTNSDGTTSTTTTTDSTTCTGSSCTTTTTSTTSSGSGGASTTSTSTTTESKDDYCAQHPTSDACDEDEEEGSFSGSCSAGFTCEGDAIQCAIAKEQHQRNCQLLKTDSNDSTYTSAIEGTDASHVDKLKSDATQVDVGTSFNQSGFGWGTSCPADPSIDLSFANQRFEIPFSRICGPLGVLSLAGVGITLLGSALWVLGGRKEA